MQQNAAKRKRLVVIGTPCDMYIATRGIGPDAARNDNAPRHDSPVAHLRPQLLTDR